MTPKTRQNCQASVTWLAARAPEGIIMAPIRTTGTVPILSARRPMRMPPTPVPIISRA
jgi:hypothetical protein